MKRAKDEPVVSLVVGVVLAAVGLLAAFGVEFTEDQIAAVGAFVSAAVALAVYVRGRVTPDHRR